MRLLVVVDKQALAVRRLATATRVGSTWLDLDGPAREEILK